MNLEKINDEYNYVQNLHNNPKRNYSLNNKVNILNKKTNNNMIQKEYILKLLKTNNQIFKNKPNLSKLDINSLPINKNEHLIPEKELKYKLQLQEKNHIINNLMNEIEKYKNGIKNNHNNTILNKYNDINKKNKSKNFSNKNIFVYSPQILLNKNNEEISSMEKSREKNEFRKFHTLDNEHRKNSYKIKSPKKNKNNIISILINDNNAVKNEVNLFKKYKYRFPELKKNKIMQKNNNNLTHDNNKYENAKINKLNNLLQLNERNNTSEYNNTKINQSKFYLINSSNTNSNNISNNISKNYQNNEGYNEQEIKLEELKKRMNNLICNLFSIIETNKK